MALAAALIGAGTSILGNVMSNAANAKQNSANRDFQSRWNHQNREWALEDWAMQNEYNSPKAQMARLRDANLNPHMVYGGGATTEAQQVRASPTSSQGGTPNRWDFSGVADSIMQYQDIRLKETQSDNLMAQRNLMAQDAALKAAQTLKTLSEGKSSQFDYEMKEALKQNQLDVAHYSLNKLVGEQNKVWNESRLLEETNDANISKAKSEAEKALNEAGASKHLETRVLQEIDNLKKDGNLKQFQMNLNRLGIQAGDPVLLRIMTQLFGNKVKTP